MSISGREVRESVDKASEKNLHGRIHVVLATLERTNRVCLAETHPHNSINIEFELAWLSVAVCIHSFGTYFGIECRCL